MDEERYYLKDTSTKEFLKGFKEHEPLWTLKENEAADYSEMDALHLQVRFRTENILTIVLVEKLDK